MHEPLPPPLIGLHRDGRTVALECQHGEIACADLGPRWSEAELVTFAQQTLSARAHCTCFGPRTWFPPVVPAHVEVDELRLFETDLPDPFERTRPRVIPPHVISKAADRLFETAVPDGHPLERDLWLVRFWWWQRNRGELPDDDDGQPVVIVGAHGPFDDD